MSVNALPRLYFVLSTLLQELWSPWCPFSYFIRSMLSSVLPAFKFILSHLTFGQSIMPIWLMFMMSCGCMCVCIRCPHEQNTLCKLQAEVSAFELYQGMQNIVITTIYIYHVILSLPSHPTLPETSKSHSIIFEYNGHRCVQIWKLSGWGKLWKYSSMRCWLTFKYQLDVA